ncbi:phosphatase PAP2 family protein [Anatilimnocola floriformis]|uniref:phosphatase PAP2 family protein n=1 Tax=Anatilimnocola floriformis TaxID=2948575 RepID=UPI0020C2E87D|nr:phosphatase PAP2 family protein [Anatilimnocola floriformis]
MTKDRQVAIPTARPAANEQRRLITPMRCLWASAVLTALTIVALPFDVSISAWMKQNHIRGELERIISLCEFFGFGWTVLFVAVTAAFIDRRGWRVMPRLVIGSLGVGLVADLGKIIIARWRPNADFAPQGFRETFISWLPWIWPEQLPDKWNRGFASFPSGHSATAVGLALALSTLYPKATLWFIFLAGMTMLQRVESRAHYPSDTFAGAALACFITAVLLHSNWLQSKFNKLEK